MNFSLMKHRIWLLFFVCILSLSACHSRRAVQHSDKSHSKKDSPKHKNLEEAIKPWLGTPYKYGGNDRKGVDCSGFVHAIYQQVYAISLPRSSKEMYNKCTKIKTSDLKKGDLVFFDFEGMGVSHVGIYLSNNEYAHASTSKGVVISNLDNVYMQKRYVGAGRITR